VTRAYVVGTVDTPYPLAESVEVIGPAHVRETLARP
jgi:hypothetical protein